MRSRAVAVVVLMAISALAACSGSDGDDAAADGSAATPTTGRPPSPSSSAAPQLGDASEDCPAGFGPGPLEAGAHEGFESEGQQRSFHLLLPELDEASTPRPLFVSITGTVQEEQAFLEQSELDQLPDEGWIVVAPVRNANGKVWGPWDAMRPAGMTDPNPDEALILDLIACISAHHPVDAERIFVGGISIGGTMVNYLLRRHSEVFAGGIVGSGNFILTAPDDPQPLDDMTVIVAWGGDRDQWTGCPDGRMGEQYATEPGCVTADFVADAASATEYYASEPNVRVLACSEDTGHIWISHATSYWADVLADSPKGTTTPLAPVAAEAPAPMTCTVPPGAETAPGG